MTVSSDLNRKDYAGDGVTLTPFSFPYYFFADSDLKVTKVVTATGVETTLVLNTDYTVAGAGDMGTPTTSPGGFISLTPAHGALPVGTNLTIIREVPALQPLDYIDNDTFPAESHEKGLDRLTMICQQILEKLKRSLLLPVTSTIVNLVIPDWSPGKFWRWNSLTAKLENADITGLGAIGVPVSIPNGGTAAATALGGFDNLKQLASEIYAGVAKVATQALASAGVNDTDFITALKLWTTPMRGGWRNIMGDNGGLEIWQRGAGGSASIAVAAGSTTGIYTADRVYLATQANQASTVSQQAGLNSNSGSCARVQRNAGQTGVGVMVAGYPLDADEIRRLRGRKASLRCEVRAGANWSPTNGTLQVALFVGTGGGPAKRALAAYTGETVPLAVTINLTPGGAVVTVTAVSAAVVPANITQADLLFIWTPTGTAGAADYFEVDDVDLRVDEPVIDQFERRPFFDELRACKVHFQKSFAYGTAPAQNAGFVGSVSWKTTATGAVGTLWRVPFETQMRADPTVTLYNPAAANAQVRNFTDSTDCTSSSAQAVRTKGFNIDTTTPAGTAVNETMECQWSADAGI